MNRRITATEASHIRHLLRSQHLKLREVREHYPQLSLAQIHRIGKGTNWSRATGLSGYYLNTSPDKLNH